MTKQDSVWGLKFTIPPQAVGGDDSKGFGFMQSDRKIAAISRVIFLDCSLGTDEPLKLIF